MRRYQKQKPNKHCAEKFWKKTTAENKAIKGRITAKSIKNILSYTGVCSGQVPGCSCLPRTNLYMTQVPTRDKEEKQKEIKQT